MSIGSPARTRRERVDQWSLVVFVAVVALAVPLLLYLGRDQWFFLDEWWLLGDGADSLDGYFESHNGHWITLTAIVYRINYELWGLHSYLPYQVPVVLVHVGSAILLRLLMRRLGVRGWIATFAALIFVFFGSGGQNLFFGFQLSVTGSLFCGLALFLLADRDGALGRRDVVALAVGLVGLTTSGVFVPMVAGVAVAVLLRRGLVAAAFYAVPPALVYGIWYLSYGRDDSALSFSASAEAVRFVVRMLTGTFTALAGSDLGGIALGFVVLVTVGVLVGGAIKARQWTALALPAGVLTAWAAFACLTALARASEFGAGSGESDRYIHITAALFLPLIALGAEYLARENTLVGFLPLLPLAVGLPGNVDALANPNPFALGDPNTIEALAHSEYIDDVRPDFEPLSVQIADTRVNLPITAGWLAREARGGAIPEPTGDDPTRRLNAYGLLALRQEIDDAVRRRCPRVMSRNVELTLGVGEQIVFDGRIQVMFRDGRHRSNPFVFDSTRGRALVAELGPLNVLVGSVHGDRPRLCQPSRAGPPLAGTGQ